MGPLQTWGEDNGPHPGYFALRRDQEPFEENHNASLMWQTFLCALRSRNFASQNQKDLLLGKRRNKPHPGERRTPASGGSEPFKE